MGTSPSSLSSPSSSPSLSSLAGQPLAPQAYSKESTTLDNYIMGIQNLTGQQGQGILGAGQGQVQAGQATTNQGITALGPALSLLTNLVQGNQADITQAAQPEIDQISQQFDQIRNLVSLQPRGGGKTSALAEAPFQQAGQIQRTEGQLRSNAVGQLSSLGTSLANIGLGQSGVGLQESNLGLNLEQSSANDALQKQGLNYGQQTPIQQFATLAGAIF